MTVNIISATATSHSCYVQAGATLAPLQCRGETSRLFRCSISAQNTVPFQNYGRNLYVGIMLAKVVALFLTNTRQFLGKPHLGKLCPESSGIVVIVQCTHCHAAHQNLSNYRKCLLWLEFLLSVRIVVLLRCASSHLRPGCPRWRRV